MSRRVRLFIVGWSVLFVGLLLALSNPGRAAAADSSRDEVGFHGLTHAPGQWLWVGTIRGGETVYTTVTGDAGVTASDLYVQWICGSTAYASDAILSRAFIISPGNSATGTLASFGAARHCSLLFHVGSGSPNIYGTTLHFEFNEDEVFTPPSAQPTRLNSDNPTQPPPSYDPSAEVCLVTPGPSSGLFDYFGTCASPSPSASPPPDPNVHTSTCTVTGVTYVGANSCSGSTIALDAADVVDAHLTATASLTSGSPTYLAGPSLGRIIGTLSGSPILGADCVLTSANPCTVDTPGQTIGVNRGGSGNHDGAGLWLFRANVQLSIPCCSAFWSATVTVTMTVLSGPDFVPPASPDPSASASPGGSADVAHCYVTIAGEDGLHTYEVPCPDASGAIGQSVNPCDLGIPCGSNNGAGGGLGGPGPGGTGPCQPGPLSGLCKPGLGAYGAGGDCPFPDQSLNPLDYFGWIGCLIASIPVWLANMVQFLVNALLDILLPSPEFFDQVGTRFQEVRDSLWSRAPFSYIGAVSSDLEGSFANTSAPDLPVGTFHVAGATYALHMDDVFDTMTTAVAPYRGIFGAAAYFGMIAWIFNIVLSIVWSRSQPKQMELGL